MKQCVLVVAVSWMNDQTCRFVNHQQIVVLIDDVERNILRRDGEIVRLMIQQHLDNIAGFNAVIGCYRVTIHPHITCVRSRLDTVTAGVGHVLGKVFVYSFLALPFVHFAPPALPEEIVFDDIGYR